MKSTAVYKWLINNHTTSCLLCLSYGVHSQLGICEACRADLPWLGSHCRQCALPLSLAEGLCGQCMNSPPAFNQIVAPFLYGFPIDSLILAFKHHHQLTYGRMLGLLLLDAVRFHYQERQQALPDCLIPMPLHGARQAKRGFNQAMELARPLARRLSIPVEHGVLLRQRATQAQQGLDARARRRNLKDAFVCRKPKRIHGKHIALVEDVVTTGTTVREASRVLLDAGAASVSVWCVARTDA